MNLQRRDVSSLFMIAVTIILVLIVFVNLFPFFNLLLNSLRGHRAIISRPLAFDQLSFSNYRTAEEYSHLMRGLFNGVWISFLTIVMLLLFGSSGAYALSFIPVRAALPVKVFLIFGYFIPPASILINGFLFLRDLHLLNSFLGLAMLYGGIFTSFTIIFLTGFMSSIPGAIIESSQIDGASHLQIYRSIVFPMLRSAFVTLTILLFLWTYREFMWPLVVMARPAKRTIAVSLSMFVSDRQMDFGVLSAAVVVSLVPIVALYAVLSEKIMSGMAAGSVKG